MDVRAEGLLCAITLNHCEFAFACVCVLVSALVHLPVCLRPYVRLSVGDLQPGAVSLCAGSESDRFLQSETPFSAKFLSP